MQTKQLQKVRIKGKVTDSRTGKPVPFANVYFSRQNGLIGYSNYGVMADSNGNYLLNWPADTWITASSVGYEKQTRPLPNNYEGDQVVNFELKPGIELTGVNIVASPLKKINYLLIISFLVAIVSISWFISVRK